MSKYQELLQNPPRLTVKKGAREVIIKTVSCMCDNVHYLKLKKNSEGDFRFWLLTSEIITKRIKNLIIDFIKIEL